MLDNAAWLDQLAYIPFLRDVGRHFSVNRMLSMDSVKLRLDREQNLSFLEFNYMLLQSYDFLELFRQHGVALQMGGSDQWGNIVLGADLIRRVTGGEAHVLTTPLITSSSGAKMGKTASGAIWLSAEKLSPFDYWQFWRNTEDGDVGRFMKLFTEMPLEEIARLEALSGAEINEAKKVLATEATTLLHGRPAAEAAAETARKTFEEGEAGEDLPRVTIPAATSLTALLVQAGFATSNAEARRHVAGGGVRVDDVVANDPQAMVAAPAKLSFGKKKHALIVAG
jgi:tyrosyl-tRNA synthetase